MTKLITMPQRLASTYKPGELQKGVVAFAEQRREPPERNEAHLKLIRQCFCLNCGVDPAGEAAHVRMTSAVHGKRKTGIGQKPADRWTVPLCSGCHTRDPDAQHRIGEIAFWHRVGLNPLPLAVALWNATGDLAKMRAICFGVIAERESISQWGNK